MIFHWLSCCQGRRKSFFLLLAAVQSLPAGAYIPVSSTGICASNGMCLRAPPSGLLPPFEVSFPFISFQVSERKEWPVQDSVAGICMMCGKRWVRRKERRENLFEFFLLPFYLHCLLRKLTFTAGNQYHQCQWLRLVKAWLPFSSQSVEGTPTLAM